MFVKTDFRSSSRTAMITLQCELDPPFYIMIGDQRNLNMQGIEKAILKSEADAMARFGDIAMKTSITFPFGHPESEWLVVELSETGQGKYIKNRDWQEFLANTASRLLNLLAKNAQPGRIAKIEYKSNKAFNVLETDDAEGYSIDQIIPLAAT